MTATKTVSGMGITTYTTLDMRLQVNNSHEPCPNMDAKGLEVFEEVVETQADKHDRPHHNRVEHPSCVSGYADASFSKDKKISWT